MFYTQNHTVIVYHVKSVLSTKIFVGTSKKFILFNILTCLIFVSNSEYFNKKWRKFILLYRSGGLVILSTKQREAYDCAFQGGRTFIHDILLEDKKQVFYTGNEGFHIQFSPDRLVLIPTKRSAKQRERFCRFRQKRCLNNPLVEGFCGFPQKCFRGIRGLSSHSRFAPLSPFQFDFL